VVGKIIKKINDVTYVVTARGWRQQRVLHVDKLKKMEKTEDGFPGNRPSKGVD